MVAYRHRRANALMLGITLALLDCAACDGPSRSHAPARASAHPTEIHSSGAAARMAAMHAQTVDGYTIDVPIGWVESTTDYGGSTTSFTFAGGNGQESVEVSLDFCTGYIQHASGDISAVNTLPYLQERATAQGSTNVVYASPLRATFDFPVGDGLLGYGVVVINTDKTTAIEVKATVLVTDARLGPAVVGSVEQPS